jgi:hypothetical protein
LLKRDQAAALGGLGLEAGGLGGDFDGLRNFAELEIDSFDNDTLGGGEYDVGLFVLLEALGCDGEFLGGREELGEDEGTGGVGLDTAVLAGTDVVERDLSPWDGAARLVGDRTGDRAGEALGVE